MIITRQNDYSQTQIFDYALDRPLAPDYSDMISPQQKHK